jgi:hypothetical protein
MGGVTVLLNNKVNQFVTRICHDFLFCIILVIYQKLNRLSESQPLNVLKTYLLKIILITLNYY